MYLKWNKFIALLTENRNNELPFTCLPFTKGICNVLYWNKIIYVFVFVYLFLEVKDTSWILVTINILPLQQFGVYRIILQETNNNSWESLLVSIKKVIIRCILVRFEIMLSFWTNIIWCCENITWKVSLWSKDTNANDSYC